MFTTDEGDVEKWKLELVRKFFGVQGPEIASDKEADLGYPTRVEKAGFVGDVDGSLRRNKDVKIIEIEDSSSEDDDELHVQNKGFPDAEIYEAIRVANSVIDLILDFIPESTEIMKAQDFAEKVAREIIDLVIDSVIGAEVKCVAQAKVEDIGGTIDASHVVFSCIDVRLKTGFQAPSPPIVRKKDKKKAEFELIIVQFLKSKDQQYIFSSELNSYERRLVHELGGKNKLVHESVGEGKDRHIMLKKTGGNYVIDTINKVDTSSTIDGGDATDKLKEEKENKVATAGPYPRVVGSSSVIEEGFKNIVAPPGEPVEIPDIEVRYLVDGSDEEFCQELAEKLKEKKMDMVQGLVKMLGRELVLNFFWKTREVEASGGVLIMNGARRRTSGGVFLQLLRKTEDRTVRDNVDNFVVERQREDERKKSAKIAAAKEKNKKRLASELKEMFRAEKV